MAKKWSVGPKGGGAQIAFFSGKCLKKYGFNQGPTISIGTCMNMAEIMINS